MQPIHWLYAVLWLLVVPAAVGMALAWHTSKRKSICFALVCGYAGLFAMAQILIVPGIFLKASLTIVMQVYRVVALIAASAGLVLNFRGLKELFLGMVRKKTQTKLSEELLFFVAILLVAIQMLVVGILSHQDGDDSFYVATASTSIYTDSIFAYNPYTGAKYRGKLPSRYVLSPFPVYEAILAKLVGVDVPCFVYTIFPVFLILLAYLVYWLWADQLFDGDKKQCALFLIFTSVVLIFSNYSIYTSGTFLMLRIWQGKAILAGVLLPAVAYLCVRLMAKDEKGGGWPALFCMQLASCLVSSMGIILSALMVGIYMFVCGVCAWKWKNVGKALLCCLPNLVFAVIYLFIR